MLLCASAGRNGQVNGLVLFATVNPRARMQRPIRILLAIDSDDCWMSFVDAKLKIGSQIPLVISTRD